MKLKTQWNEIGEYEQKHLEAPGTGGRAPQAPDSPTKPCPTTQTLPNAMVCWNVGQWEVLQYLWLQGTLDSLRKQKAPRMWQTVHYLGVRRRAHHVLHLCGPDSYSWGREQGLSQSWEKGAHWSNEELGPSYQIACIRHIETLEKN